MPIEPTEATLTVTFGAGDVRVGTRLGDGTGPPEIHMGAFLPGSTLAGPVGAGTPAAPETPPDLILRFRTRAGLAVLKRAIKRCELILAMQEFKG